MKRHPELMDIPKNSDTLQRLCEAAIECWEELKEEVFNALIRSMPSRLQAVIDAQRMVHKILDLQSS